MNSFWRIFSLELLSLIRSGTVYIVTAAAVGWTLLAPTIVRGDGTAEGFGVTALRYTLGGAVVIIAVAFIATATAAFAKEREAKRLQLTLVRPVRYAQLALYKMLAHTAVAAVVLAVVFAVAAPGASLGGRCSHVLRPTLPSPREEAETMYDAFMKDPSTPEAVRKAGKGAVIRLLARKAVDHYQTVQTNSVVTWKFPAAETPGEIPSVRLRFTNPHDMRQDVRGLLSYGGYSAVVSNITLAANVFRLGDRDEDPAGPGVLSFANRGRSALMLRPRRDVELMLPADSAAMNYFRCYLELLSLLALLIAFGVFLGAAFGRPTALFTAVVFLALGEMTPSVLEQYPDELESDRVDRIGLVITRAAAAATHPLSAVTPIDSFAGGEAVEWREVLRTFSADAVLLPLLLALLSSLVIRCRER